VGEVKLPGGKRANTMPQIYGMQLIDDERLLLLFNLSPATSVSVVDIVAREVLGEIDISGCALIYPTGERGFSSLCSDGSMHTVQLDTNGQELERHRTPPFFDVETAPLFEKPAIIGGIAYFPGFHGNVQPIDLRAAKPVVQEPWSLLGEEDRAGGWRPGGWQLLTADADKGHIYILMHPEGYNGSHKDGGPEVWVFDVQQRQRLRRITLQTWGISLALTRGERPYLLVTNAEMNIDVYRAADGGHVHTLADFGQETPFVIHATR